MNNITIDKRKFWLAAIMMVAGISLLFTGMLIDPSGIISNSVIAGAGEIFVTGGAILGIDVIYSNKLKEIINEMKDDKKGGDK